ncbi:hypothetical protein [Cognaticolwellia beringensis]|uniref:Uncharacterized protein n=1 Tax=Cognaticolwellia beringensis TaxID=1967665 RepID=A0A222G3E1_9GAMM|nr:hypothetical protein [Cognaticolwellia beringensis]ASP46448.1 hypothetical protein B5D82_00860 [Cognaticolwellia beringensis]
MANLQPLSIKNILIFMVLLLSSGCELTTKHDKAGTSYGEYYLALQGFNEKQLTEEVSKQQVNAEGQTNSNTGVDYDAKIKLLLLYSLPKSPIYNSFQAKALLNDLNSEDNNSAFSDITPNEEAFFSLLRDQLNQRLLMRNRLLALQEEQRNDQQESAKQQQHIAKQQQQQLIEQVKLLEQTIKQLKSIEQAIDKRDQ